MGSRCIEPAKHHVDVELAAVPSKSCTHRALVAAALACGESRLVRPLDSDDTRRTRNGLRSLGVPVEGTEREWVVSGSGGSIPGGAEVDCGGSGTTARFLTALASLGSRPSRIDGSPRLRERPIGELVDALRAMGARAEGKGAGLPVTAGGSALLGGTVSVPGGQSSQFASALLLVGAACRNGLDLTVEPPRASFSYALLTADVLACFGVRVDRLDDGRFGIAPQRVSPATLVVEGDHSSASYLLLAAAITGGRVSVTGLDPGSLQPDARFAGDLASVGCAVATKADRITVTGTGRIDAFDWDFEGAPDLAPTAAVLALFARDASRLRGLANLHAKESDRLSVLQDNAARLGARARIEKDSLVIEPPAGGYRGAAIDVAGDHRIAMAFAVAGLRIPGLVLSDPGVVEKSYPTFWCDFEALTRAGAD